MARRSNGEGSIAFRKDGRWQASLQVDGRRKTVYGKTRSEVARKLAELQRQAHATGALPASQGRTVDDLLTHWLEAKAPSLKTSTLEHYRLLCDDYIRPPLGPLRLDRLTPERVQNLYSILQGEGHHRTARLVHCILRQAGDLAVRWHWLTENPAKLTIPPSYKCTRKDVWTPEEFTAFLTGTEEHRFWPLWVVAVCSGCRIGELLALTWEDVDWNTRRIHIHASLQRVDGHYLIGEPKTAESCRTITLPPEALAALDAQKIQQSEWQEAAGNAWASWGLVFTGETGSPLHRSVVAHALKQECKRLGISEVTPHGLRHLHASLLLAQGLPVPLVSARLGHANPGVTMEVYAHYLGRGDAEAARAIGKALEGR